MNVLEEANRLVHGGRENAYGHPLDNFYRVARMWEVILDVPVIDPGQVALCLCALKIARQVHQPKPDNLIDLAGYAETAQMVIEEERRREG